MMFLSGRSNRKALALIIVAGVLAVLAILAACFVTLARLERRASQRRIHQTQALFLARSGVEDALARMDAGQNPVASGNAYRGEDWDSDGILSSFEARQLINRAAGQLAALGSCPLDRALSPSFHKRTSATNLDPALLAVDGRQRGTSGLLATDEALTYAMKVEDESGKINVNGGFLDSGDRDNNGAGDGIGDHRDVDVRLTTLVSDTGLGWNFQLCQILGALGQEPELGMPATFGTDVLTRRPLGGYVSIVQLQSLLSTTTDLSPYLTTSSWVDRKVIQPNSVQLSGNAVNEIKKLRVPLALDLAGRPPVNLNTAPRALLRALLRRLGGYNCHDCAESFYITLSPLFAGVPNPSVVDGFVDQMLVRRASNPFRDWTDFSAFCDDTIPALANAVPGAPAAYIARRFCLPDLVKANFDPNTALNKDLPDQLKFRFLDKSDLKVWSTEGCFESTGIFRITGLGRVRGADGKLLAERHLAITVRLFDLLRQTTQKDFLAGRPLGQCHSLSTGSLPVTGAGASWKTWGPSSAPGLSTLSYPNPPTVPSSSAADFDGYLGLATVEASPPSPLVGGRLMFLHHLDDSWTADSAVDPDRVTPGPSDSKLSAALTSSVWPSSGEANTLRPDGLHIQRDRCPAFLASNMPAPTFSGANGYNRGEVSLWVKPAVGATHMYDFSSVKGVDFDNTQVLLIGRQKTAPPGWGVIQENRVALGAADSGRERPVTLTSADIPLRRPMLRWALETVHFDTNETVAGDELKFDLRSVHPAVSKNPETGVFYTLYNTTSSSDLFARDTLPGTSALIVLGHPGPARIVVAYNASSYAVIDEVCICDFGDAAFSAVPRMGTWAADRFNDGRYYKENDARFLSASLSPDGGASRLLWARWTAYLPKENRKEIESYNVRPTGVEDRLLDPRLLNSAVELELLDRSGGFSSVPLQGLTQGGRIGRTLDGFRYRVTFKPNLADLSDPVLESPFLDDVTFAWQPQGGPRILAWSDR